MKKILIAIPTDKIIESETFKSIYNMIKPEGYQVNFEVFTGYDIDEIRNTIVTYTIENNFDYLFCVDHDIIFESDTLFRLLSHDVEMISGIYRQRLEEHIIELYDCYYENIKKIPDAVFDVGACGFGCVLIKTSLLKAMNHPYFEYKHSLDHRNTISEDVYFCKKASKYTTIFADPNVRCDHVGKKIFRL